MANFSRLHDLYAFPGFAPAATVHGVFGDPYAVVISYRRRRKKHAVESAAHPIVPSTIKFFAKSVISIAEDVGSICNSPFAASLAAIARP
jgi:hypothetical protein